MTRIEHNTFIAGWSRMFLVIAAYAIVMLPATAHAGIIGETGTSFSLTATEGYISVSDGGSIYSWGYTSGAQMQLPGPTLIVTEGDMVTVTLTNDLPAAAGNVSIVFPGQDVTATGGVAGDLVQEATSPSTAGPGIDVTYTFTAGPPGTYQYHSGTQPDLQVEMGLFGALIVRPAGWADDATNRRAYGHAGAYYDREYLYVLSEIDIDIHQAAELQAGGDGPIMLPTGAYHSEYWLMNGRAGPDTMAADFTAVLPTQPYGSLTRMHPGEKVLVRVIGAGREMHPFHTHGNHVRLLGRDARLLVNGVDGDGVPILSGPKLFTIPSLPGGTADAIFQWTGKDLGWDMYGHTAADGVDCVADADGYYTVGVSNNPVELNFAENYGEWCADHEKEIPVTLPAISSLAFGGFYSGSPYLGALGSLPPGEGGLNPDAGFAYMWHSHTERELVNNDVFPGGMMTMLIVEAPWVVID